MIIEVLCAILLVIILWFVVCKTRQIFIDDRISVLASDGREYKVRDTPEKKEIAETLARLNGKIEKFFQKLEQEAEFSYKPMVTRLRKNYNPATLSEGQFDKRYTSYTVNKGEKMVLCLRSRDEKDEIHDDNLMFYVVLHELGHVASVTEDHSPEFHKNFRYLLKKASEWNMFKITNGKFNYCGMDINGM